MTRTSSGSLSCRASEARAPSHRGEALHCGDPAELPLQSAEMHWTSECASASYASGEGVWYRRQRFFGARRGRHSRGAIVRRWRRHLILSGAGLCPPERGDEQRHSHRVVGIDGAPRGRLTRRYVVRVRHSAHPTRLPTCVVDVNVATCPPQIGQWDRLESGPQRSTERAPRRPAPLPSSSPPAAP